MYTEQDTIDRLRRSTYAEACAEYTMVFMQYEVRAGIAWCEQLAEEILSDMGWSINDLIEYERVHNGTK